MVGLYTKKAHTESEYLFNLGAAYFFGDGVKHWFPNSIAGEPGLNYGTPGYYVTAGAGGPGYQTSTSTYHQSIPGPGDEDGWARGATFYYGAASVPISRSYGSAVNGTNQTGKQGVVRVRWWA